MKTAQQLIRESRMACEAVAEGPFTVIAFERYEFIGGERGWHIGHVATTIDGYSCIVWA